MSQAVGMATTNHDHVVFVFLVSLFLSMYYNKMRDTRKPCRLQQLPMFHRVRVVLILIGVLTSSCYVATAGYSQPHLVLSHPRQPPGCHKTPAAAVAVRVLDDGNFTAGSKSLRICCNSYKSVEGLLRPFSLT